jgi:4-hydroxy-2-oxoheptanedioate aldolase
MHDSVHAVAACGVSPIVRIPGNEGWMVKRALDAGAHGIIVPLLYTVEDARRLVQSAKFPPMGKRGFGSPFSMGAFDVKGDLTGFDYMNAANENLLTIVQIETKEAFENVSLM